jgi:mono/diheme cytochrome c family protein
MRVTWTRRRTAALIATLLVLVSCGLLLGRWRMQQREDDVGRALTGGQPGRAPALLRRYGCVGCHTIAGVGGADGQVAPSLEQLRQRVFIGGVARNTPDNLVRWIVDPHSLSPHSAMPATGITVDEARDVAAYLYAH